MSAPATRIIGWLAVLSIVVLSLVPGRLRPHVLSNNYEEHFVAYIVVGGVVGPSGFRLIDNPEHIRQMSHIGVILLAVGLVASSAYLRQAEFVLEPGETARLGETEITYVGAEIIRYDNRIKEQVTLVVDGETLTPALERFVISGQVVSSPDTRSTLTSDVQVALLRTPDPSTGEAVIRATRQPMIVWLWIGGFTMLAGAVLSAFPGKRRRQPTDPVSAPIPLPAAQ